MDYRQVQVKKCENYLRYLNIEIEELDLKYRLEMNYLENEFNETLKKRERLLNEK